MDINDTCYVFVASNAPGCRIGIVRRGESGYYRTDLDRQVLSDNEAKKLVQHLNHRMGVSPHQAECMLAGSLFGWSTPGADPALTAYSGVMAPVADEATDAPSVGECASAKAASPHG